MATRQAEARWPRAVAAAAVLAVVSATGGCSTVDLGDPPADVNACRPSQQYFYDQIAKLFAGGHCGGVRITARKPMGHTMHELE